MTDEDNLKLQKLFIKFHQNCLDLREIVMNQDNEELKHCSVKLVDCLAKFCGIMKNLKKEETIQ